MSQVFVTEDDPDVRTSIAEILREEGYDVREFPNGEETLRALKAGGRPSVVLVDLLMPEMSGQEFVEALRSDPSLAGIAVVMITGARATFDDVEVLRKPFELEELVSAVERHCGGAARPS
ncbi:MAG TPA: response regulator [Polyangiaceae bacterium]|nr:response regulator [Polyangiaceae bacterium]